MPRNGRADEEHRIGSIGNLDRPTRFGREIMRKPGARRARFDTTVTAATSQGLAKNRVEEDAGTFRTDHEFKLAVPAP